MLKFILATFAICASCVFAQTQPGSLENLIGCIDVGASNVSQNMPTLQGIVRSFRIDLDYLRQRLDRCNDSQCSDNIDKQLNALYEDFVISDVLNVAGSQKHAEVLDDYVRMCSDGRHRSTLLFIRQSPQWCWFSAIDHVRLNHHKVNAGTTNNAVWSFRSHMISLRNCKGIGECIQRIFTAASRSYFQFISDLLIERPPNGIRWANSAENVTNKCMGHSTTQTHLLFRSELLCHHQAAGNVTMHYSNLAFDAHTFIRSLAPLLDAFERCKFDRKCIQKVDESSRAAFGGFLRTIRKKTNGAHAERMANGIVDVCSGRTSPEPEPPTGRNSTIGCYISAMSSIPQPHLHTLRSPLVNRTMSNLHVINATSTHCNNERCRIESESVADRTYLNFFTDVLMEIDGVAAANITNRIINRCNGNRPTQANQVVNSVLWCFYLGATELSIRHPTLNFYVRDLLQQLQPLTDRYIRCEFHRSCQNEATNAASRSYTDFSYQILRHPRGTEILRQADITTSKCLDNLSHSV